MKQLIFVLILLGGGYYVYQSGMVDILKNTRLDPAGFVEDVKKATASTVAAVVKKERFPKLPHMGEGRQGGLKGTKASIKLISDTIINTYDVNSSYALVDVAYSSGAAESKEVVNKYLANFSMPEDRAKVLELITQYQDGQTLEILTEFVEKGAFSRRMLFKKIVSFEHPDILPVIEKAMKSTIPAIQREAKRAYEEVLTTAWYKEYSSIQQDNAMVAGQGKIQSPGASIMNAIAGNV